MNKKLKKILLRLFLFSISAVIIFIIVFFSLVYSGAFGKIPSKDELINIQNEEASLVYSNDIQLIGKYFAENRTNISWDKIPEHLTNALIATEDKRYYSHEGYDVYSYFRVFFKTLLLGDKSAGGGSTITQQLIKNIYGRGDYGFLSLPIVKVREAIIAKRMEEVYTKNEILLLYFNSVPFGENVYGVESAAQRYFNKACDKLKIEEAATLIGLLKANSYYNPRLNPENSVKRRNVVLKLMENENYISESEYDSISKLNLNLDYENFNKNPVAAYFVYQVKKEANDILQDINLKNDKNYELEKDGLIIQTTLDYKLQTIAANSAKKHLLKMQKILDKELKSRNHKSNWTKNLNEVSSDKKHKIALAYADSVRLKEYSSLDSLWHYQKLLSAPTLIINPENGDVLSWIGGINFRYLPYDLVYSKRQIASTFKPILYAGALENDFSACDYLQNEEVEYEEYDNWHPRNYDYNSTPDSNVAFWYALTNSMNLPSIDLFFKLGFNKLENSYNKYKLSEDLNNSPSTAIGTVDLSLFDIIKAYSAFSNKGIINDLNLINKITDSEGNIIYQNKRANAYRALKEETALQLTAILENVINQGTGQRIRNQYGIKSDLAGKTGTAQNYSNAWFVAYTPSIVLGTWVGTGNNETHFTSSNGSGSALALPLIAEILKEIEKDKSLNSKYLTNFSISDDYYKYKECSPYKQLGIKGFLNRTFIDKEKQEARKEKREERREEREEKREERKEERQKKQKEIKKKIKNIFNK